MKNYIYTLLTLFALLYANSLFCQKSNIDFIELTNSALKVEIKNYVQRQKKAYPKFDSLGYIVLSLKYYNSNSIGKELKYSYNIKDQYVSLEKKTSVFPPLYTYISDKLILLYIINPYVNGNISFKNNSKRKLTRKINKCLGKSEHLVVRDKHGEIIINDKDFRKDEEYNLHGGISISIYADDNISVIKNEI
jgi:hypothetical protein